MQNELLIENNINVINQQIKNCQNCILHTTRTNAVTGNGNIRSKILLIGEAPGKNEDKRGIPFVGSAGKVLDQALVFAGLERKDIYITNIVKCRPPNNRVPQGEEILKCNRFLEKEMKIISPKIIGILGATALHSLLNLNNIQKYRGKTIVKNNIHFFITYHPAATIYNKKLKDIFFNDIKRMVELSKEERKNLEEYFIGP